ncbi:MAG TPA: HEPN domain-containing protein [Lacunisphaera sp.]|nr:HEPN domain-containing protein [Lacunisphaera sp.]
MHDTIKLYDGIKALKVRVDYDWLLRGAVVFLVSAFDAYFHDRIKYGVSRLSGAAMPEALRKHRITIGDLADWQASRRKGNIIRNWIAEHLSTIPLQSPERIAEYMRYIGINGFWNLVEPDSNRKKRLLAKLGRIIQRRNQIAHEGDRLAGRKSKKALRTIDEFVVKEWIQWIEELVHDIDGKADLACHQKTPYGTEEKTITSLDDLKPTKTNG